MKVFGRYRLATLFAFVGMVCVVINVGLRIGEANRRKKLIALCAGGTFVYRLSDSWEQEYESPLASNGSNSHAKFLLPADLFYPVVAASLMQLTDDEMREFGVFTSMERLRLSGCDITDAGLVALRNMATLTELYLDDTGVDGSGFVHLKHCAELRRLVFGSSVEPHDLSPYAFKHLGALRSLDHLEVYGVKSAELRDCGSLQRVRILTLGGTPEGRFGEGQSLNTIQDCRALEELTLVHAIVNNELLQFLSLLPKLRTLYITKGRFGEFEENVIISRFAAMSALQLLVFTQTELPSAMIARMSAEMPDCDIRYRRGDYGPYEEDRYVDGMKLDTTPVKGYGE